MWSCCGKTLCLWSTDTGAWLGKIETSRGNRDFEEDRSISAINLVSGDNEEDASATTGDSNLQINSNKGLDVNAVGGLAVTGAWLDRSAEIYRQIIWAQQSDSRRGGLAEQLNMTSDTVAKNASKAVKAIGKWGSKLVAKAREDKAYPLDQSQQCDFGNLPGGGRGESFTASATNPAPEDFGHQGKCRAVVAGSDGFVWVGHHKGLLERYTYSGCLQWSKDMGAGIRCASRVGQRIWVGLACGTIHVFSTTGKPRLLANWAAHSCAVIGLVQAGRRVFSLAHDASIRGWSAEIPSTQDESCQKQLESMLSDLVSRQLYRTTVMTWNVNEQRPTFSRAFTALSEAAKGSHVVAVGLQEVEMGSGSVARAAAMDAMARGMLEKGNANAQWWDKQVLASLGPHSWRPIGLRQLSGMLVLAYSHVDVTSVIGDMSSASVATGVLGVGGNKGAVALGFTLHRRRLAFVCSHFAPHQTSVEMRNANYRQIAGQLAFKRPGWEEDRETASPHDSAMFDPSQKGFRSNESCKTGLSRSAAADAARAEAAAQVSEDDHFQGESMRNAEMLVWMGDFNYRIDSDRNAVIDRIHDFQVNHNRSALSSLLCKDQLLQQKAAGAIFRHMHEAPIHFAPTYKFDKGDADPMAYDSSEKQRVPAWTDRIIFRGSEVTRCAQSARPSRGSEEPEAALVAEEIRVTSSSYTSVPAALESDHKPVLATLDVNMPVIDQAKRRHCASAILMAAAQKATEKEGFPIISLSKAAVVVQAGSPPTDALHLCNSGTAAASFLISAAKGGGPRRGGLPAWLTAHPVRGFLEAGEKMSLYLGAHRVYIDSPLQANFAIRVAAMFELGGPQPYRHVDVPLHVTCNPGDVQPPPMGYAGSLATAAIGRH